MFPKQAASKRVFAASSAKFHKNIHKRGLVDIKAKEKVVKELLAAPSCSCRPPSVRVGVKRGPPLVNCWPTGSSSPRARDRSLVDDALVEP